MVNFARLVIPFIFYDILEAESLPRRTLFKEQLTVKFQNPNKVMQLYYLLFG